MTRYSIKGRMNIFDENSLHAEIIRVWGPAGAHAEVFEYMLKELKELKELRTMIRCPRVQPWPCPWQVCDVDGDASE